MAACALALVMSGCGGGTSDSIAASSGPAKSGAASTDAGSTASVSSSLRTTSGPPAATPTGPPAPKTSASPSTTRPDGQVYDATRDAEADVDAALALARADGKRVLIDFGANWCPDCLVLDRQYRSPQVAPILRQRYHVVTVDIGRGERNRDLSRRYGDVIANGIPALVILDARGKVVTTTKDGSFADARSLTPAEVSGFLRHWAGTA